MNINIEPIKLTQYSHGAGCGCKISPKVLEQILETSQTTPPIDKLWVGNDSRDDAAVFEIGQDQAVISTTDFFMPIVDDPFDFGRIAAANSISDIYAMGGDPLMAISILGWPISKITPEYAREVVEGGRSICAEAGIPLAGGHSIDSPEPIFGLAVTGMVTRDRLKRNDTAKPGNSLYLTKPLGVGILSTAQKQGKLKAEHRDIARDNMVRLNRAGLALSKLPGVCAITDVTGFGLLGHLSEMCEGSKLSAELMMDNIPLLPHIDYYVEQDCIPGGTNRNWDSYGYKIGNLSEFQRRLLCDPQTSGGLLVAVDEATEKTMLQILRDEEHVPEECLLPIGQLVEKDGKQPLITVH
ncbi:MAG TPA: selenide, water dikinase SelD [Balneolales bacterium]|nr:selenide, water dikinase SelD [Balneolales bacterium]